MRPPPPLPLPPLPPSHKSPFSHIYTKQTQTSPPSDCGLWHSAAVELSNRQQNTKKNRKRKHSAIACRINQKIRTELFGDDIEIEIKRNASISLPVNKRACACAQCSPQMLRDFMIMTDAINRMDFSGYNVDYARAYRATVMCPCTHYVHLERVYDCKYLIG